MSKKTTLGDTEKTVIVGALVLGFWVGIGAIAKRAERRDIEGSEAGDDTVPKTAAARRVWLVRSRHRRQEAA